MLTPTMSIADPDRSRLRGDARSMQAVRAPCCACRCCKDDTLLGAYRVCRREVRPFTDKRDRAAARIRRPGGDRDGERAAAGARCRQRQEELRITFENMGDGVAMFDETQRLVAWNGKFQEISTCPTSLLEQHRTYEEHLRFLAARGDFGAGVDAEEQIARWSPRPANPTAMSARGRMAG